MRRRLYPERASSDIQKKIEQLAAIENGAEKQAELSAEEQEEILSFETSLGNTLETVFDITVQENTFYPEYFLAEEGQEDLRLLLGDTEIPPLTLEAVSTLLYTSTYLKGLDAKVQSDIAGRSRNYSEEATFQAFRKTKDQNGLIQQDDLSLPIRTKVIFDPEKLLTKQRALRKIKEQLRTYRVSLQETEHSDDARFVINGILDLYHARVNDLLIDGNIQILTLQEKSALLGEDSLTDAERELLEIGFGLGDTERTLSKLDKLVKGAAHEYEENGYRQQLSQDVIAFADEFEAEYISQVTLRNSAIEGRGLDREKLFAKNIPAEKIAQLAEETLTHYSLLSQYPASDYESDREGPAPDDKWQFVMRDAYKTMAVSAKQKIIKCSPNPQSIDRLISITLAHEIEGHVIQAENRARIPLRLFAKVGGGRSSIFAECGAMNNQDYVSGQAFGYQSPPHPYYIKAMQKKLEGGSYLDCVEAFYEGSLKELHLQRELGWIDQEEFDLRADEKLKLAINRTKRLFESGAQFGSNEEFLTNSKDTVYLEQVRLYRALKQHGLEKYAFISGANLDTLLFLMQAGFLNPSDIQQPHFYSLTVWDRLKDNYQKITS